MARGHTKSKRRGGQRPGAGRPKSMLPQEMLDQLGPIPFRDPLNLARWFTDAIALLTLGVLEGKPWKEMLETVRASASAAGRVLPNDIIFEAARIVNKDAQDVAKNSGGATPIKRENDVSRGSVSPSRRDPSRE